jgi:hypothetical protein
MRMIFSIGVGAVGFVALIPVRGDETDPPIHYSVFGYEVPSVGIWLALAVGVVAAAATWFLLNRRSHS